MSDIGIKELVFGILVYWVVDRGINRQRRIVNLDEPNQKDIEIRRTMENIKLTGGVDPQLYSRLKTMISAQGLNFVPTNPNDSLRTLAEMMVILQEHPIELERREIPPPPAPNSRPAIRVVQSRLVTNYHHLQGPTENGTPTVFITS